MPARRPTLIALLRRVTTGPGLDGPTLHFSFRISRSHRDTCAIVRPEHVPEFEGHEAWFELERVPGKPWGHWRALRRVEPPGPRRGPDLR
jgi:hypothetical protein